jgi:tRNA (Thr-GGU) A37 N-methylase
LHRSEGYKLTVVPFLDDQPRGLFATRAPRRPNAIGLSIVRLERIENGRLYIRGVDILEGTPLLDIKPYIPSFDDAEEISCGWLEDVEGMVISRRADRRFLGEDDIQDEDKQTRPDGYQ